MKYQKIWQKILTPGEEVKFEFSISSKYIKLTSIIFLAIALFLSILTALIISMVSAFLVSQWGKEFISPWWACFIFLTALLGVLFRAWYLKRANIYGFSNKRILIHRGWLNTKLTSIDYGKITDATIHQPFIERILYNTGSLYINTAGTAEPEIVLNRIEKPYLVKRILDKTKEKRRAFLAGQRNY